MDAGNPFDPFGGRVPVSVLSSQQLKQIQQHIHGPEGAIGIEIDASGILNRTIRGAVIFEVIAGEHFFRLDRDDHFRLNFFHYSPGTGTRQAAIDLNQVQKVSRLILNCAWNPDMITLRVIQQAGATVSASGTDSNLQFRIGKDGKIYSVVGSNASVARVSLFQAGKMILQASAIETWRETVEAVNTLATNQSSQSFTDVAIVANLTLASLVTGFEAYAQKRFIELEGEGIAPNIDAIIATFFPDSRRRAEISKLLEDQAVASHKSPMKCIVDHGTINFQNFRRCKIAYNKAYGVKFGHMNVPTNTLKDLQAYIGYRHKIVHVSPLLTVLNQDKIPPEQPIFPNMALANAAKQSFQHFIGQLHRATLNLRPR